MEARIFHSLAALNIRQLWGGNYKNIIFAAIKMKKSMKKASISFTCTFFMQKSNIVESKIIAIPVELVIACCRQLLENTSLVVHFFIDRIKDSL